MEAKVNAKSQIIRTASFGVIVTVTEFRSAPMENSQTKNALRFPNLMDISAKNIRDMILRFAIRLVLIFGKKNSTRYSKKMNYLNSTPFGSAMITQKEVVLAGQHRM